MYPKEVKSFLKLLVDPYLSMEMIDEFVKSNSQTFIDHGKIDFDFLYSLMKPTLLSYKSLYEVSNDVAKAGA